MSQQQSRAPKLGIILPDEPVELEMKSLDRWTERRGRRDFQALTLPSRISGGHDVDALYRTGSLEVIGPVARALAESGCDAVVWACTSGSFIGGLDWARAQAEALAAAAGRPAGSTTLAFIAALNALDVGRVDVLGAYPEPVTRAFIGCLGAAGFAVGRWTALGTPDGPASYRLDLTEEVVRFAAADPADGAAALLIPDTAIDSLDLVEELERRSGRLVLTANQVSLWYGLTLLGLDPAMAGLGRLFAGGNPTRGTEEA